MILLLVESRQAPCSGDQVQDQPEVRDGRRRESLLNERWQAGQCVGGQRADAQADYEQGTDHPRQPARPVGQGAERKQAQSQDGAGHGVPAVAQVQQHRHEAVDALGAATAGGGIGGRQQRGVVEQQVDHEQADADGQVDNRRPRSSPVDVPEQQVQHDSDEQEGHGQSHVGPDADRWHRRAGAEVLSAGFRSSGDVDAGVHAHLDDGGDHDDEQVDGTSGSGKALAPRDQRSSNDHHDLTMTGPCDGRIRPWACVALAAGTTETSLFRLRRHSRGRRDGLRADQVSTRRVS